MPTATTGPGPATPTRWWTGSRPAPRGASTVPTSPTSSTSAAGPASGPGRFRRPGGRGLGVDPDARMADLARRHGLEVEVSTFEAWHNAGRSFDSVVSGQAWHWVDPVAGTATAARAARPRGRLRR